MILELLADPRHVVQCLLVELPGDASRVVPDHIGRVSAENRDPSVFQKLLDSRGGELGVELFVDLRQAADRDSGNGGQQQDADEQGAGGGGLDPGRDRVDSGHGEVESHCGGRFSPGWLHPGLGEITRVGRRRCLLVGHRGIVRLRGDVDHEPLGRS